MKVNNLMLGLALLLPTFFMQAGALVATSTMVNAFTVTVVMVAAGALFGCLGMRARLPFWGSPLRLHLAGAGIGAANCGVFFLLTPAVEKLGIGPATTIFALGAVLVNARTDLFLRLIAVIGVSLVNRPWMIVQGNHESLAIGVLLAALSACCNWAYVKLIFGGPVPKQQRPEAVGLGLTYTSLFGVATGALGYLADFQFVTPTWSQAVPMVVIGVFMITIPGITQSFASERIPDEVSGFVFNLATVSSAATGAIAHALGYAGPEQAPTLLGWTGVSVVLGVMALVTRNDNRRRREAAPLRGRD